MENSRNFLFIVLELKREKFAFKIAEYVFVLGSLSSELESFSISSLIECNVKSVALVDFRFGIKRSSKGVPQERDFYLVFDKKILFGFEVIIFYNFGKF